MKQKIKLIYMILISLVIGIIPLKVNANSISLNKSETILGVGYTETLKVTVGTGLNASNVVWTSSNSSIVSVINGKITGLREGVAIITAAVNGQRATCYVKVNSSYVAVEEINLNKTNINILVGSSETLIPTIKPNNATNKDVSWTSSDPTIATVVNGKVTAKKVGKTIITVSSSGHKATCIVNVVNTVSLKEISLNKTNLTIKENSSETLKVIYNPSNATNKKITWKSSNQNVAIVDANGVVTGISEGSATITAISNDKGYVATCKVIVEAISKKVTGVTLDKKEVEIEIGTSSTLKATVTPSYAENKNVIWESSDTSIATVENGKITPISPGTVEIKVLTEDGKKEAKCTVKVIAPPIKKISFEEPNKTVYVDSETQLLTVSEPEYSSLENPIWTSSNELVATVENGIIKATSIGETIITVSNQDGSITASINITVISKPKEKLKITIEGYKLNFDPNVKTYDLKIGNEDQITINTNMDPNKVVIKGNRNLENGSIITIEIMEDTPATYIINIKKNENYTIIFISIISVLLLLNLIRIIIQNKKSKS